MNFINCGLINVFQSEMSTKYTRDHSIGRHFRLHPSLAFYLSYRSSIYRVHWLRVDCSSDLCSPVSKCLLSTSLYSIMLCRQFGRVLLDTLEDVFKLQQ